MYIVFLCVPAYHLLVAIEKRFLEQGLRASWWTIRQQLSTHQVVTVVLPARLVVDTRNAVKKPYPSVVKA